MRLLHLQNLLWNTIVETTRGMLPVHFCFQTEQNAIPVTTYCSVWKLKRHAHTPRAIKLQSV